MASFFRRKTQVLEPQGGRTPECRIMLGRAGASAPAKLQQAQEGGPGHRPLQGPSVNSWVCFCVVPDVAPSGELCSLSCVGASWGRGHPQGRAALSFQGAAQDRLPGSRARLPTAAALPASWGHRPGPHPPRCHFISVSWSPLCGDGDNTDLPGQSFHTLLKTVLGLLNKNRQPAGCSQQEEPRLCPAASGRGHRGSQSPALCPALTAF